MSHDVARFVLCVLIKRLILSEANFEGIIFLSKAKRKKNLAEIQFVIGSCRPVGQSIF